jgi:hypothetical protein
MMIFLAINKIHAIQEILDHQMKFLYQATQDRLEMLLYPHHHKDKLE